MRNLALCAVAAIVLPVLCAQQAAPPTEPGFEVASIRPAYVTPGCYGALPPGGTHYALTCVSLRDLIAMAWRLSPDYVEGGGGGMGIYYDLNAVTPGGVPWTDDSVRPLLRRFLTERFRITVQRGTKQVAGYDLTVARGGPKLERSDTDISKEGHKAGEPFHTFILPGYIHSPGASLVVLAGLLSSPAHAEVRDRTGIEGTFKIDLHFAAEGSADSTWPDLFTAVTEQLGLKLQAAKITVDTLIVDRVEAEPAAE